MNLSEDAIIASGPVSEILKIAMSIIAKNRKNSYLIRDFTIKKPLSNGGFVIPNTSKSNKELAGISSAKSNSAPMMRTDDELVLL